MDVARLNMSHGDYSAHQQNLDNVRAAAAAADRPVGVLADLQGPKIRLGRFASGKEFLENGATFAITVDDIAGTVDRCSTTYKGLPGDVNPGDVILIDDGRLMLKATEVTETDVVTEVVVGGDVSNNKGINLPGVAVSVPAMSAKDTEDLRWALRAGVDMIALSFVRSASDIDLCTRDGRGGQPVRSSPRSKSRRRSEPGRIIAPSTLSWWRAGSLRGTPIEEVTLVRRTSSHRRRRWPNGIVRPRCWSR